MPAPFIDFKLLLQAFALILLSIVAYRLYHFPTDEKETVVTIEETPSESPESIQTSEKNQNESTTATIPSAKGSKPSVSTASPSKSPQEPTSKKSKKSKSIDSAVHDVNDYTTLQDLPPLEECDSTISINAENVLDHVPLLVKAPFYVCEKTFDVATSVAAFSIRSFVVAPSRRLVSLAASRRR